MARPVRGRADFLQLGDWNAVCWECGRKRKASEMKKHWQGYWVCPEHWEARHPQDFVRSIPDVIQPPWQQPPEDVFPPMCSWEGRMAIAGVAMADCAICDFVAPGWADIGQDFGQQDELNINFQLGISTLS